MHRSHITLTLTALLFSPACKKQQEPETAMEESYGLPGPELPLAAEEEKEVSLGPPHVQEMARSLARTFFELDSADLTAEAKEILDQNAEALRAHADVKLEIQGHADERGTTEYNLALGQKRAQAVYDYMVNTGIGTSRLAVISYGEEHPLDTQDTEQAWSQNRRAEFRITWGSGTVEGTTQ